MFLALLLLSQARGEWVEISQQYYTKPARPHHPLFTSLSKPPMDTKPNRIYINQSLPQYNWNTGVDDVPHNGNFENVQPDSSTVRRNPDRHRFSVKNHEQRGEVQVNKENEYREHESITVGSKHDIPRNRIVIIDEKRKDTGVDDIPNIGNSKNVQPQSGTVRRNPQRHSFVVESDEKSHKVEVIKRNEHNVIASTTVGPKHEIPRNRIVIIDEQRKETHRLPSAGIVQRVQLSTTKRPTTLLTDFTDIPLEVLNLSDLEYTTDEDVFSTIEIGDDATNIGQFTHKKHLTANVPIQDKPERNKNNDDVNKLITKYNVEDNELMKNEFTDQDQVVTIPKKPSISKGVKTPTTTKSHSVQNKASNTAKAPQVEFMTTKESNSLPQYSDNLEPNRYADKNPQVGKIKLVQLVKNRTENPPNYVLKRKPSLPNTIVVTDKYSTEYDGNDDAHTDKIKSTPTGTPQKHMTVKSQTDKSYFQHYELTQRPFAPSPEEVMLDEILKQDESNIKVNIHHTLPKTGTVNRVQLNSNKTIKGNQNVQTNDRPNRIKNPESKSNQVENSKPSNATAHDGVTKPINTASENLKAEHRDINTVKPNKDMMLHKSRPKLRPVQRINLPLQEFVTEAAIFTGFVKEIDNIYMKDNIAIVKEVHATSTEEIPIRRTLKVKPIENFIHEEGPPVYSEIESYEYNTYHPIKTLLDPKPEFVIQDESVTVDNENTAKDGIDLSDSNTKIDKRPDTSQHFNTVSQSSTKPQDDQANNFKFDTGDNYENEQVKPNDKTSDSKTNPMDNLVRFVKVVTETISKNTRRSFKGKMRYLEDLRDTIMANIEERIDTAFPDERARRSRQTRGHHVDFPSSESALMTISFLTFAVFLIKLVLQVIQTYKNKTMMVPAVVATVGRALGEQRAPISKQ